MFEDIPFTKIIESVVAISGVIIFGILAKVLLNRFFNRTSKLVHINPTNLVFLKHVISLALYTLVIVTIIYQVPSLRGYALSIFAGAGLLVAIIGFASQQAFSNIISGIFIVMFKPFRVNDRVEVGIEHRGVVEDITLRHTVIRNFENKRIIIPNSIISSQVVVNQTIEDERICRFVEIGISYDSNIDKAMFIMQDEAEKHPLCLDARTDEERAVEMPQVRVRVIGFGDSSVMLRAYVWAKDPPSAFEMGCDLNKSIKERFDREGVEIPFAYRTIVFKKDLGMEKMDEREAKNS